MKISWADRVAGMENPAVTGLLKIMQRSDIISFSAGSPSPLAFPINGLAAAFESVFKEQGPTALQYGISEGYLPLREWVANRVSKKGIACSPENVLITSGSHQALDLIARTMLNPGDYVAVENPAYLSALQTFRAEQANFLPVPVDHDGMRMDILEESIRKIRPKFIYVNPTFQNPTGITMSIERRKYLSDIAVKHEIPVIEDDPYGELRYSGSELPSVKSFNNGEWIMYAGTASKIIAPGLRVGWLIADEKVIRILATAKQLSDVLTNSLTQRAIHRFVADNDIDAHIAGLVALYRRQRDIMLQSLKTHFPAGIEWTVPDGGMFIWVVLPERINTVSLLGEAIETEKVAFVPGNAFYADDSGSNTLRLNFSNTSPELIETGIAKLGKLLKQKM